MDARTISERRQRRSLWASEALHLQLLQVAAGYQLEALVLADELGNMWAASGLDPSPRAILRGLGDWTAPTDEPGLFRGGEDVLVKRLQVGTATLFLAARGGADRSRLALEHAAPGVTRILTSLL